MSRKDTPRRSRRRPGILHRRGYVRDVHLVYRWRRAPEWLNTSAAVQCSLDAWPYFRPLERRVRETVMALYLNRAGVPLGREIVHVGTMTRCCFDAGEILRSALHMGAAGIIVAHNHPSGQLEPSVEDKSALEGLNQAAALVGVKVLDSLIIVPGSYFSMEDARTLRQTAAWYAEGASSRAAGQKAAATRARNRQREALTAG